MPTYEFTRPITALEVYQVEAATPEEAAAKLEQDPGLFYQFTMDPRDVLQFDGEFSEPYRIDEEKENG